MSDNSLVQQPRHQRHSNKLRAIFKQYLLEEHYQEHLTWKNITKVDGLPHNWIYDLYQDSQERIWAGTWGGGVARFEAGNWKVFTKKNGLHCNQVTCIREDSKGFIWLATDNGLNFIEGDDIRDGGLAGKSLLNITLDQHGYLWAGCWRAAQSGGGLFRFDGHSWDSFTTFHDLQLPGLEILKVFNNSQGRIWVGTYEHGVGAGVGCYNGKSWLTFTSRHGLINDCVYSMFEDPSGNMWFGTVGGISIFDGKNWHNLTHKDGLIDNRIYCMLIDSHKKMWFGTETGISRFDGSKWNSYTKKDGLVENLVRSIIETKDGSLWFGTYPYENDLGGISIVDYPVVKKPGGTCSEFAA